MENRCRALDYFKNERLVFCAEESGSSQPRGHISYIHSSHGSKVDLKTGRSYQKSPLEGRVVFQKEQDILSALDPAMREFVSAFYRVDPYTGETYLRLPEGINMEHISSTKALNDMLHGNLNLPAELVDTFGAAVEWIKTHSNIPDRSIGLYGGIGAGLYAHQCEGKTDVDFTIHGEEHASIVRDLCSKNQPSYVSALLGSKLNEAQGKGMNLKEIAIKSPQRSIHPQNASFFIDTIVVRDPSVSVGFPSIEDNRQIIGETTINIVVDDNNNGLALPVYFGAHIQGSKQTVHIYSPRYRYLAAFQIGTAAQVCGLEIDTGNSNERTILLLNPDEHRIEYE